MSKIHTYIACLKTQVSAKDFLTIVSSVGLPLTTITTVDPAQQDKLDKSVDALRIRDHMPDPSNVTKPQSTCCCSQILDAELLANNSVAILIICM